MKFIKCFIILLSTSGYLLCVEFDILNGSDLMVGVGARQIALGGAGSLLNNSPGSIFWNSASLIDIDNAHMQVDFETPGTFNNLLVTLKPNIFNIDTHNISIGFSIINRLKFKGKSNSLWNGYATHLLDLTMIDVEDFTGKIDSKSFDYRIAIAIKASKKLNLGVTFVRLV